MERDNIGNSVLHYAVENMSTYYCSPNELLDCIDYLLNFIDINDRNEFGETPLHKCTSKVLFSKLIAINII